MNQGGELPQEVSVPMRARMHARTHCTEGGTT